MQAPVFIVGCPRSGTTLLRDLLRSHPNLTFPPESQFIPRYYRAYGNPANQQQAIRIGEVILRTRSIRTWQIDLEPKAFAGCRTFREILCLLFGAWLKREGKTRWGDKTPQYVMDIPLLLELFPEAKIIHIIRDGRDVALSSIKVNFEGNIYKAACRWDQSVRSGRRCGASLPSNTYHEVRYEALLAAPAVVMRQVCDFLEEPYTDCVLQLSPIPLHALTGAPWIASTPANRSRQIVGANSSKWKTSLSASDCLLFESVAGDLLLSLGYPTAGRIRKIGSLERVAWHLHHCIRYAAARVGVVHRPDLIATFFRFRVAEVLGWIRSKLAVGVWKAGRAGDRATAAGVDHV